MRGRRCCWMSNQPSVSRVFCRRCAGADVVAYREGRLTLRFIRKHQSCHQMASASHSTLEEMGM